MSALVYPVGYDKNIILQQQVQIPLNCFVKYFFVMSQMFGIEISSEVFF